MRLQRTFLNISMSLLLQLTNIISGLIIPWLIIRTYGSGLNGLLASVTQFLSIFSLVEGGIGGVIRASLYKHLAQKNLEATSSVLKATNTFFRKVALVFIFFLLILAIFYPFMIHGTYSYYFVCFLVLIMGIKTFAQYFFGITNQILLQADQKLYLVSVFHIVSIIANVLTVTVLVYLQASIHIVQIFSVFVLSMKPLLMKIYVNRNYKIIEKTKEDKKALSQKWDGIGHHIAYFLHNRADIIILTIFTDITLVSVYSVYLLVSSGVKSLTTTFSSGMESVFGDMIAKKEQKSLEKNFDMYEFIFYMLTSIVFVSASLLILPFISIYTLGVSDADYIQPLFAYLLLAGEAIHVLRLPYHSLIMAAGHFRETRNGAFLEAFINIFISILLVNYYGLVGVAFGTIISTLFRTVQYAFYMSKNILNRSVWKVFKRFSVNMCAAIMVILLSKLIPSISFINYYQWIIYALIVTSVTAIVTLFVNTLFYYNNFIMSFKMLKRAFNKLP